MTIEVVVPALRQQGVERLTWSLLVGSVAPDVITIVSNEVQPFPVPLGATVRLLRFASDEYATGEFDVALRQNCGIWAAGSDHIIISGDDQIAPPTMVEDTLAGLVGKRYLWGNHRLLDFEGRDPEQIRLTPRSMGLSRENPEPPAWHGYTSCYGGMFAAEAGYLREVGAFDMAFNGLHAGEDQHLGYRLMRLAGKNSVWITEPPFSWHSIELRDGDGRGRTSWLKPVTNVCDGHDLVEESIEGIRFKRCQRCPARRFDDKPEKLLRPSVLIPFRPEAVTTSSIWLNIA